MLSLKGRESNLLGTILRIGWFVQAADVSCRHALVVGVNKADHSGRIDELFGSIAKRYDLVNDLQSLGLHRLWKRRLVALSEFQQGEIGLDLCCGTGDLAERIATQGGWLVGIDRSEPMLGQAVDRLAKQGENRVHLVQSDALSLPLGDDTVDLVTIGYGLRNLASVKDGLREIFRVLKPRGRLLILDFGKPTNRVIRGLYYLYLAVMLPLFGWLCCRNASAYAYILKSLKNYTAQAGVLAVLHELGCHSVEVIEIMAGTMSIHRVIK